jgi:hypothetical protein
MTDTKKRIDLEEARTIISKYRELSKLDPNEIELFEEGVKVDVPQKNIDDWKFTGLNLSHYIEDEFYKHGFTEIKECPK